MVAFYGVVQDGPGGTLATVAEYMVDGSLRHVLLLKDRLLLKLLKYSLLKLLGVQGSKVKR